MDTATADRIRSMIADLGNREAHELTDDMCLSDDLGFDSLDRVELQMDVEDAFGFTIDDDALDRLITVGDVMAAVAAGAGVAPTTGTRQ